MAKRGTVLVTGAGGFIGRTLCGVLECAGWEVVRWARRELPLTRGVDLMDCDAIERALDEVSKLDAIIHLAALNQDLDRRADGEVLQLNVGLLSCLLNALGARKVRLIFASSVAVYGPCYSDEARGVDTEPAPVTSYGLAKLACERLLNQSSLREVDVVRLPPVYSETAREDLEKRVRLPGTSLRVRLRPAPTYTMLPVGTAAEAFVSILNSPGCGHRLHVLGGVELGQDTLVGWFRGRQIPFPVAVLRPLVHFMRFGPQPVRRIADKLGKVCFSNRYESGVRTFPSAS